MAERTIRRTAKKSGLTLPRVLVDFYQLVGKHEPVCDGMNHLLRPESLYLLNDGLVFEEENQQYYLSGILTKDLEQDDPPVHQGNRGEDKWHLESKRLSNYLLSLICWQACNVLPATTHVQLKRTDLDRLKSRLDWCNFGVKANHDTLGIWGDGVAVAAFTAGPEAFLASRSQAVLDAFCEKHRL